MKKLLLLLVVVFYTFGNANAQWKQTNGPTGGQVLSIAARDSNIIVGTQWAGSNVYISHNYGKNWVEFTDGLPNKYVFSFAFIGNNIYAGTDSGVYVSTVNGSKWFHVMNGLPAGIRATNFAVSDSNIFCVGSGVYLSTDYGNSWKNSSYGLTSSVRSLAIKDTLIIAAGYDDIYVSGLKTIKWKSIKAGLPYYTSNGYNTLGANSSNIFLATDSGLYVSADNGLSWVRRFISPYIGDKGMFNLRVQDSIIIFNTDYKRVFISYNNGLSWDQTKLSGNYLPYDFAISDNMIYSATQLGGVITSADKGLNWTSSNNGLISSVIPSLAVNGSTIFAGTLGNGIFKSDDDGTNWIRTDSSIFFDTVYGYKISPSFLAIKDSKIFATSTKGAFVSNNNGATWKSLCNEHSIWSVGNPFAFRDSIIFAVTYPDGIYSSSDNGQNWVAANKGIKGLDSIHSIAVCGHHILIGAGSAGLFRTTDDGKNWISYNNGFPNQHDAYYITALDSTIFANINQELFISNDKGLQWIPAGKGLAKKVGISSLIYTDSAIFISTGQGIFMSSKTEINWKSINEGLADMMVSSLVIKGGNLIAGTYGNGVWKRSLSDFHDFYKTTVQIDKSHKEHCFPEPYLVQASYTNADGILWGKVSGKAFGTITGNKGSNQISYIPDSMELINGFFSLCIQTKHILPVTPTYDTITVAVSDYPDAAFKIDSSSNGFPKKVYFKDQSKITYGSIDSFSWDFGNSNYSSDKNPFTTYSSKGTYKITHFVKTKAGCIDSVSSAITISDSTVDLPDKNPLASLYLYPNPAHSFINLVISKSSSEIDVILFNTLGDIVSNYKIESGNYSIQKQLDVSALPRGVYFIKIQRGVVCDFRKVILE